MLPYVCPERCRLCWIKKNYVADAGYQYKQDSDYMRMPWIVWSITTNCRMLVLQIADKCWNFIESPVLLTCAYCGGHYVFARFLVFVSYLLFLFYFYFFFHRDLL